MRTIVAWCLRFRFVVVVASVLLLVVGYRKASQAPVDVFPEFAPPRVEIQTEAPGLTTLEVETLVTAPIESAVTGVAFVKAIRSKSVLGLSSVVLVFQEGVDLMQARQLVQERLSSITHDLPAATEPPVMLSPLSSTSRVLKIGVSSDVLSQTELTDLVRWTVRPRLMGVKGVANVAIWGERDRELQVRVDPDAMQAVGASLDDIVQTTRDSTAPLPGGFLDTPTQRLGIMHVPIASTKDELANVLVATAAGGSIRLGDIAEVVEDHPAPIGDAVIDGKPGLLLIVEKQPWGNTVEVTQGVERALDALRPALPDVNVDPTIFRPATFVERAMANLTHSMAIGCALVVVILLLFLFDLRTAIISAIAIPLSIVSAATILAWRGSTLNTMVLAGLVIALGEVVDDAIIDVENILRRFELNAKEASPRSAFAVVLDASLEVRSAVVFATMIVMLAFLPIFFLDGLAGAFFRPLAEAYALAVAASLVVALTVTPALCLLLLPSAARTRKESFVARTLRAGYRSIAARTVGRPRLAILAFLLSLGGAGVALPFFGESFLPDFHETDFLMHWVGKPGTSLAEMRRVTVRVSNELRGIDGVRNFGSHIGRAEVADEVVGPNFAELWISLDEKADYEQSVASIQATVAGYPGLQRDLQTYLQERMKEVLSGASGSIVVRLFGPDLAVLRSKAGEIKAALASVEGVTNLKVEQQVLVPQVVIRPNIDAFANAGLAIGDTRAALATLLSGQHVGEVYRNDRVLDVVVWGAESLRADVAVLRDLHVTNRAGVEIRLGDVASVDIEPTPNTVQREASSRRIDITCDARGRDLGAVARDVEARAREIELPAGYHPELLGEYAARQAAQSRLGWLVGLALVGMALVLYADFRSSRTTIFLMLGLPFALVGGVAGVAMTGSVVSLGSLIGFVTVLGIAARNGIMLVSHFRHLELEEGVPFGTELILRGASERVVPILMTALATGLALVPLVVAGNRPGNEIEHPMAIVILGGLVTSTLLNLLLVPPLYLRFGRSAQASADAGAS